MGQKAIVRWFKRGAVALSVAAATLLGAQAAHSAGYLFTAEPDNPIVVRGCVIRFDERTASGDTRPTIHANEAHYCVGVDRVYADYRTGDLVLAHGNDAHRAVVSIAVSPDETLVSRGIDCGASGGVRGTRIRCYDAGARVKPWSHRMYGPTANLWVTIISWAG